MECRTRPWLIEPSHDKYIYIRMRGLFLRKSDPTMPMKYNASLSTVTPIRCNTKSRVIISNSEGVSLTACPLPDETPHRHMVEVFSAGWTHLHPHFGIEPSKVISVEFLHPDDQTYSFTWLEISKRGSQGFCKLYLFDNDESLLTKISISYLAMVREECQFTCPGLDACVNGSIFCDGIEQCPSGEDESFTHCSALLRLPAEVLAGFSVLLLLLCCGLIAYVYR